MDTNSKSSTLLLQDSQPPTTVRSSHNSLTLLESVDLERSNRQHQKSISRIYTAQAWIYFQKRNWHKAVLACKNALESDSKNVDAFKILGNIFKLQGKKAEALGIYAKALQINPDSAPIYANLGSFYAEQQDWQQALDYYQQAVILDPNLAGAYRSLAQVWEELGDRDRALECLCRAVNIEPEKLTSEQYFSFGKKLYHQGNIKEASIFYTHGVELAPHAESELAELVKMLEELEEWEQAVIYYHRLISLPDSSKKSDPSADKPIRNLLSGAKTKAKKSHLSLNPHKTERSLKVVSAPNKVQTPQLLPIENSEQATRSEDAATKRPTSAASWNNLGSLYARKQQWAKAISCYQEALQLDPGAGKTHRNLARIYDKMGQNTKANLYWYEAYTLEPEKVKPEAYFDLAKGLLQQRQADKAIACLRRVVELKPDWLKAHLILGKLLENQGESAAARACYQKIKSLK